MQVNGIQMLQYVSIQKLVSEYLYMYPYVYVCIFDGTWLGYMDNVVFGTRSDVYAVYGCYDTTTFYNNFQSTRKYIRPSARACQMQSNYDGRDNLL